MDRQDWLILGAVAVAGVGLGVVKIHGSPSATVAHGKSLVRRNLATANTTTAANTSTSWPWIGDEQYNRWSAPAWEMAKVGVTPLRQNHPLFRRPEYAGCNRHKVMTDGWDGWYYDSPQNAVL